MRSAYRSYRWLSKSSHNFLQRAASASVETCKARLQKEILRTPLGFMRGAIVTPRG